MRNARNRIFRRNKFFVVALIAIVALFAGLIDGQGVAMNVYASTEITNGMNEKSFSHATIDEDFVDDTVVVVFNQQESLRFSSGYTAAERTESCAKGLESS